MKTIAKIEWTKTQNEDNRWLTFGFIFKNEEIADEFMDKMEKIFEDDGEDFKFARCPEKYDDGTYYDAIDVNFEQGNMRTIRDYIFETFKQIKNEMKAK